MCPERSEMLKLEALKNGLPQQEEALEKLGGSL